MAADVTKASSVLEVEDAVMTQYGRVDILVNNVRMPATGNAGSLGEEI